MKRLFLFECVLTFAKLVLKQYALHSNSNQITKKSRLVALLFPRKNVAWPFATFTWPFIALLCTSFSLTLSTTPMSFKHDHFQSYTILPPGSQVLPRSALLTTTPRGLRYNHLQPCTLILLLTNSSVSFQWVFIKQNVPLVSLLI